MFLIHVHIVRSFVNLDKFDVIVFRNEGIISQYESWTLDSVKIKTVTSL